jgi:hypothetical protein
MDVLDICAIARITIRNSAASDMNMSPHRRTDKVAHHWCSLITRGEITTSQLETRAVWPINSPARLRHGSMAGFMLLLGVTKGQSTKIATVLAPSLAEVKRFAVFAMVV